MPRRAQDERLSLDALAYFREQGARGGKKGARQMTAAERRTRARAGGLAKARKAKARAR